MVGLLEELIMISLIILISGLLIGSFLNVVILRMKELQTIVFTRSRCQHCKKELKWYDLIPFLSFILLKTKCRYCNKPISWQYPIVEVGTALLFSALYWHFGLSLNLYFSMIISMFLIVIFVYDLQNMLIPDEMLVPAIILAIIYLAITSNIYQLKMIGIAVLVSAGFLGILYLLGKGKWMGLGDVKLAVLLGLISPFPQILVTLFSAFVIGSIIGLILIALKQKKFKSEIPFGPFLIIGLYISIFFGERIINWYLGII